MKYFLKLIISCCLFAYSLYPASGAPNLYLRTKYDYKLREIYHALSAVLPKDNTVAYTAVPRGLILSIDENLFFYTASNKIKPTGAIILNGIISVLQNYDNNCVIESHTDEVLAGRGIYKEDWELSIARATAVADYLVKIGKINPDRIFALGYGDMMPFKENVSQKGFSDRRVDFVIFDYDIRR